MKDPGSFNFKGNDQMSKLENGLSQMMHMVIQDYVTLQNYVNALYLVLEQKGLVSAMELESMHKRLIAQEKSGELNQ